MPTYDFINTKTGKKFTEFMSISEKEDYLKKNKIPFILFISTEPVGKKGYMDWQEIKEVEKFDFATIGHHSHTHEYLIEMSKSDFIKDIEK